MTCSTLSKLYVTYSLNDLNISYGLTRIYDQSSFYEFYSLYDMCNPWTEVP